MCARAADAMEARLESAEALAQLETRAQVVAELPRHPPAMTAGEAQAQDAAEGIAEGGESLWPAAPPISAECNTGRHLECQGCGCQCHSGGPGWASRESDRNT